MSKTACNSKTFVFAAKAIYLCAVRWRIKKGIERYAGRSCSYSGSGDIHQKVKKKSNLISFSSENRKIFLRKIVEYMHVLDIQRHSMPWRRNLRQNDSHIRSQLHVSYPLSRNKLGRRCSLSLSNCIKSGYSIADCVNIVIS